MLQSLSVRQFADQLANKDTQPGGGSAAALMGLTGVSLLHMVLAYCEDQDQHKSLIQNLQGQLNLLHADLLEYIDLDPKAYQEFLAVMAMPVSTLAEQEQKTQCHIEALGKAIDVPLKVANTCTLALGLANQVLSLSLNSDSYCEFVMAAQALKASFYGALACAMTNLGKVDQPLMRQRIMMKATAEKKVAEHMIHTLDEFFQKDDRFRLIYRI